MKFEGNIYVTVENGNERSRHEFINEKLEIGRAKNLWIKNDSNKESDFYETVKLWNEIDKKTKTTSYLTIKTDPPSLVESFRKYYVIRVNEGQQSITFGWI